jgi:uncharacterized membrane protein
MLSDQEERALGDIERWLAADYPDMPRLMTRSKWTVGWRAMLLWLLVAAWLTGIIVTALTPVWPVSVFFGILAVGAAIVVTTSRQHALRL